MIKSPKYPATVMSCRLIFDNGGFKALVNFLGSTLYPFGKAVNLVKDAVDEL